MNPKVSIIIPAYNAQERIALSIKSILNQTYDNYEIIVVNDGSTDGTEEKIREFAQKFNKVVMLNQENKGVSEARNRGLKEASGKFVAFLDAGDKYHEDFLFRLITEAERNDSDIVMAGFLRNGKKITWEGMTFFQGEAMSNTFLKMSEIPMYFNSCGNKLFKNEIIRKYGCKFPKGKEMGEDLDFILQYIFHIQSCSIVEDCLYYYVVHENSATNQRFKKEWVQKFRDTNDLWKEYAKCKNLDIAIINTKIIKNQFMGCVRVASTNSKEETYNICCDVIHNKQVREALEPLDGNFIFKNCVAVFIKNYNINVFFLLCICIGSIRTIKRYVMERINEVFYGKTFFKKKGRNYIFILW